jgi:ubiquinone/menaquinone biosynthesis C-methylase UbiE
MLESKPQNIYDNPEFFSGYLTLRKNDQGFNALIENPAIRSLFPDVAGKTIIDLGCGFGDLCRYLHELGAGFVLGIDISERMLAVAETQTNKKTIQYKRCAIEDFSIDVGSVDLVVSSLALHYIADYLKLVKKIYAGLKIGGHFIFSVEHPMSTANPQAIHCTSDNEYWPIFNYRNEGQFQQTWFIENVIKYHRTIQTYINNLIEAGFAIEKILEPMPNDELTTKRPDFTIHQIRPPILVIRVCK